MNIEYLHASKYGNGAAVAEEFKRDMADRGISVDIHHIREMKATELPSADLYVFSSPGRIGKPIRSMRRFLKTLSLPAGTKYAILTTEGAPKADKRTGLIPTEEERARWQRVIPIMNEILTSKGYVKIEEGRIYVTGMKGPLEDGWETKVAAFAAKMPIARSTA